VLEQLYTIVNTRYEDRRAIVITTNLDEAELREQIGERTVSRLVEMCGDPLLLCGADHRKEFELPEPAEPARVRRAPARARTRAGTPGALVHSEAHMAGFVIVGAQWGTRARARSPTCSPSAPTSSSASRAATTPATRSSATARSGSST
jgi:hypothetical protein